MTAIDQTRNWRARLSSVELEWAEAEIRSLERERDKALKVLKLIRENSEDPEAVWRAAEALGEWTKA